MPYLYHAFHFCTLRVTRVFPSKSESRDAQAAFFENQDFLQRRQTRTDARGPRASPSLKGTSITDTKVTYRQVQSSSRACVA